MRLTTQGRQSTLTLMRLPHSHVFAACMMLGACSSSVNGSPSDRDAGDGDAVTLPGDTDAESTGDGDLDVTDQDVGDGDANPPGPPTSAGCIDGAGLTEGEHTFTLASESRRYVVRLPTGYTRDRAWPLVLALHGNGSTTSFWDATSGVRNIRGVLKDDAVLILVEAIDQQWRDYAMDPSTWPGRIAMELDYFEEVLSQARTALCLREDGIFAMGFSGGGSFAGVLACERDDIRAIAAGGSVVYFDEATCAAHTAAWIAISEGDLNAGRTDYLDVFREHAGCATTSTATDPSPCVAYTGCDDGTPVHYCEHPGGHEWPSFGSAAMWSFFSGLLE